MLEEAATNEALLVMEVFQELVDLLADDQGHLTDVLVRKLVDEKRQKEELSLVWVQNVSVVAS